MNLWHDPRALNAMANLMLMVAFACLLLAGIWWVSQRSAFDLLAIEVGPVSGRTLDHVDEAAMGTLGANRLEGNFFTVGLDHVRRRFEEVPWVRRAEVRRIWPNRLFVALEEHQVLARWKDDSGRFVNTHGELFSVKPAEVANHQNLLTLSGPDGSQMLVTRRYDELAHQLLPLSMRPVALELSDRQSWTARLDSGITLKLGRDEGVPVADVSHAGSRPTRSSRPASTDAPRSSTCAIPTGLPCVHPAPWNPTAMVPPIVDNLH